MFLFVRTLLTTHPTKAMLLYVQLSPWKKHLITNIEGHYGCETKQGQYMEGFRRRKRKGKLCNWIIILKIIDKIKSDEMVAKKMIVLQNMDSWDLIKSEY